ncbi:radical SAM family heme chaperone HemW [Marinicauda algicola]|uniref:Heme chaperone HemW n=1 Tax=Marinicauda algicola TaxID=2029849 RepID=A0A4S2H071_9PROT|nr:radical SAM family heme chaperone HemW [Marinicauda algicola]TGY88876.1 radical SAM family heme chaperone HemW [Marinicauda algicola]
MSAPSAPLGLYVHWPYCARICPYCDFNVYRAKGRDTAPLLEAMLADLARWREITGPRDLVSVHFGGGTPSLMEPAQIEAVLETAGRLFGLAPGAEIGLEANPAEKARFAGIRAAGVERLSLGVQALDDESLARLGRDHGTAGALEAMAAAQALFPRVSIDLIYAREGQSVEAWEAELTRALGFGLDHLSLYQLTIEPGTAFAKRAERGALLAPPEETAAAMFEVTQTLTQAAGLDPYEISNHARGRAHQSRHNRLYWTGADWIGIGPGAHSRIGAPRTGGRLGASALDRPERYVEGAAKGTAQAMETISALEDAQERVLMGLRLAEGFDRAALRAATGHDVDEAEAQRFARQGLLVLEGERARLTRAGRLYADGLAVALAPGG